MSGALCSTCGSNVCQCTKVESIDCERIGYESHRRITDWELVDTDNVRVTIEHAAEAAAYELTAERFVHALATEDAVAEDVTRERVPADWLSHLRMAIGWRWLLRVWPPKMRTIELHVIARAKRYSHVCPHIHSPGPKRHVQFFMTKDDDDMVAPEALAALDSIKAILDTPSVSDANRLGRLRSVITRFFQRHPQP